MGDAMAIVVAVAVAVAVVVVMFMMMVMVMAVAVVASMTTTTTMMTYPAVCRVLVRGISRLHVAYYEAMCACGVVCIRAFCACICCV